MIKFIDDVMSLESFSCEMQKYIKIEKKAIHFLKIMI